MPLPTNSKKHYHQYEPGLVAEKFWFLYMIRNHGNIRKDNQDCLHQFFIDNFCSMPWHLDYFLSI